MKVCGGGKGGDGKYIPQPLHPFPSTKYIRLTVVFKPRFSTEGLYIWGKDYILN
jgi:hypothetical protein